MRVQQVQQIARPNYYDRLPSSVFATCDILVGAHAATVRASYTVPANRAAFIETVWLFVIKVAPTAPADFFGIACDFLPNGGSVANIDQLTDNFAGNGILGPITLTSFGYMQTGDRIRLVTTDSATGGNAFYRGTVKGIEFTR